MIAYRLNPRVPADLTQQPDGGGDPPPYLGLIRAPYINEVKVNYDYETTPAPQITRTVTIELYYIYGGDGSTYITGPKDTIQVSGLPVVGGLPTTTPAPLPFTLPPGLTFSSNTAYYTFTLPPETVTPSPFPPTPIVVPSTTAITVDYLRSGTRLDCAQVPLSTVIITTAGTPVWQGAEVNDPCLNERTTSWTPYRPPNAGTLIAAPPGFSASASASQNSVYAPPENPPSKALIRASKMLSVGELGYIHTPNPWSYLRLQPQPAAEKVAPRQIPDWAVLDMFTVGTAAIPNPTAGRININSTVTPLAANRLRPLEALLNGLFSTPAVAATVAQNIYSGTYVNMPDAYGSANSYDTIGEICEVAGMDNGGLTEAAKEATIRRIANLITVRSNTYCIWVYAQSIKDVDKNGQFNPPANPPPGWRWATISLPAKSKRKRWSSAMKPTGASPTCQIPHAVFPVFVQLSGDWGERRREKLRFCETNWWVKCLRRRW